MSYANRIPNKVITSLLVWIVTGFLLLIGSTALLKAETLTPAQQVIQHTSDELQTTLQKPEYRQDFKKATELVDGILNAHVDFDRVSVLVLGKHWKSANPEQRERFKKEFRFLLVRTYTTAFTEYANWKIRFMPSQKQTEDKALVRTEILQPGAQPVPVDYRMVLKQGSWMVYDILIDGISLLQNYRTSFMNEVAQGSIDQLIDHLAQRNARAMKEPLAKY